MKPILKQIAKKVYKAGGHYMPISTSKNAISFKNNNGRVLSFQLIKGNIGRFRIGFVLTGQILAPTFESGYTDLGMVDASEFRPIFEEVTDNPDYIFRVLKAL